MNSISKEHFEAWLFAQPRDRVVNTSAGSDCVICQFIKETTSLTPSAWWEKLRLYKDKDIYKEHLLDIPLPNWFRAVIHSEKDPSKYVATYGTIQDAFRAAGTLSDDPIIVETDATPALCSNPSGNRDAATAVIVSQT